jgi:glycosyltransferase involved in cell wall biosynthesis
VSEARHRDRDDRPEVSVVIPTRDRWELLSQHGLPSVLGQLSVDLEVIVVDDGSIDGTATRLAEADEPRLRVLRHEQSRGMAAARNAGIAAARGEWLAFLDDDDLWSPRKLRVQLDTARATGADFVYVRAVVLYENGSIVPSGRLPDGKHLSAALLESDMIPASGSNIVARTRLVRDLGGFDEHLRYSADWDLWIRLALSGSGAACDEILAAHFKHGSNDLLRYRHDVVGDFDSILEKYTARVDAASLRRARRGLVEWIVHEYREAGYSRTRAYLQALRGQPTFRRTARAAGELFRERVVRVASSASSQLKARGAATGDDRPEATAAPDWLQLYGR